LPLKLDGTHRGFCFVEIISHDEAQKAFKELQNTHFYGRKLVIEWAQINKSVDDLREETLKKSNLINVQTHRKLNKGKIIIKK
jgi:multiple RNA-binding domain-containing protein 1